jgi:hypothetical protein
MLVYLDASGVLFIVAGESCRFKRTAALIRAYALSLRRKPKALG